MSRTFILRRTVIRFSDRCPLSREKTRSTACRSLYRAIHKDQSVVIYGAG